MSRAPGCAISSESAETALTEAGFDRKDSPTRISRTTRRRRAGGAGALEGRPRTSPSRRRSSVRSRWRGSASRALAPKVRRIVAIPIAAEQFPGVVLNLAREELAHARVAALQLLWRRETVVREVVTAAG